VSKENRKRLVELLSDGEFHSGEQLGEALGVSRASIWKQVKSLLSMGLDIQAVKGRGYRILDGLSLLDANAVHAAFTENTRRYIQCPEVFTQIDSTNQYLLDLLEAGEGKQGLLCFAEQQTAGRGRRGKPWVSPFGKNIYCSLLWHFDKGISALEGLSLVIALSLVKTLEKQGVQELELKWPNDILSKDKKLAGILIEARGDLVDACDVVIGIGINVHMSQQSASAIDQPWVDLYSLQGKKIDRNILVAHLFNQISDDLQQFSSSGFSPFCSEWNEKNSFLDKRVSVSSGKESKRGVCLGVNSQGALLLEIDGRTESFYGGEVSLRKDEE